MTNETQRGIGPVTCLLVDDLAENLLALSALLEDEGVELLQARSGAEALDLLLRHDVALALVDVQMPDMDGFALAELMRGSERTRHVPLIFVTAGVHDQHRVFKGYDAGAVDFLYKPIEPRVLRNKAAVFFQLYRQKRQLEWELAERTATLRLNETFAAVLGHDLRTPLSAILTSAQVLQMRAGGDEKVRHIADRISASGLRMSRMIQDMLDLARARLAGGIPIAPLPTDLAGLIQRAVQEHQSASPGRDIRVSCIGNLSGEWDGDRLSQVASNLIGNAIQHGDDDTTVRIHLDGSCHDKAVFTVANAGTIDAAIVPQLFEPFGGGRRQAAHREGLGLGLYIAQQIVVAHGGTIEVQQGHEGDTVFAVTVPRRAP